MRVVLLFALASLLLSSCAHIKGFAQGFSQMDDRWCDAHQRASEWRCWKGEK